MMKISGIVFDLWHTLMTYGTNSVERLINLRVTRIRKLFNNKYTERSIYNTLKEAEHEAEAERSATNREVDSWEIAKLIVQRLPGLMPTREILSSLQKIYDDTLLEVPMLLLPNTKETLEQLKSSNYVLAILSNTSHGYILRKIMDRFDILHMFKVTLFSDEFGRRKPDPSFYQRLFDVLAIPPGELLFVGDNWQTDIVGAKSMGMQTLYYRHPWVERYSPPTSDEPPQIADIKQILQFLRML